MESQEEDASNTILDAESEALICIIAAAYGLPIGKTKELLAELGRLKLNLTVR